MYIICTSHSRLLSLKNKHKIIYLNLDSARRPIPQDDTLPVPIPPTDGLDSIEDEMESGEAFGRNPETSIDLDYVPDESLEAQTFTQDELNDLVRDLALSKEKAELLVPRLKQKNLLEKNVLISHYQKRNVDFFTVDGPLCYCHDINGLFTCLSQEHIPLQWRLFIDSSQRNLKAILLHNGNVKPCIPISPTLFI